MIVQVVNSPTGGGAELLVRELHRRFQSLNIPSQVIYLESEVGELGPNEISINRGVRSFSNILRLRKEFKRIAREYPDAIIHSHLTWPLYFTVFASVKLNVRLFFTEHNTTNKRRNYKVLKFVEKYIYSRFEKIVCISDGVYRSLNEWLDGCLESKLIVVFNGGRLFPLVERDSHRGRPLKLVAVGSLSHQKNFQILIKAMDSLAPKVESLTIVGEGNERRNLENIIKRLGLEDKVNLVGWADDVSAYLAGSDVQIISSLWEGFGLVAVEGMSTGLPIVASNVSGLREVLGENTPSVVLVDEINDPMKWVEGISEISRRIILRGSGFLSRCSADQASKFSLDTMADNYLRLYGIPFLD